MLYTSLKDYYSANQLIIKICRGNMLLPWITSQFNFTYAPIYLVRHPFAVVLSQIKQGGWNNPYKKFEIPSTPYNEIYWNHSTFLGKLTTREEILTFIWCLTNQVPLNHQQNNQDWITVYYENLLLNPTIEINRIFDRWNLSIPVRIQEKYRKKSPTAINPKDIKEPHDQLSSWQHELNPDQISRMIQVLKYFDIQHYSAEDVMPKVIMK
ncbi:MAG: hypothetical protein KFF73_01595 [Cyclobacteriaceae bacterium]|nr:hypothetical protein [Cyclobacteriaceae bacterium]